MKINKNLLKNFKFIIDEWKKLDPIGISLINAFKFTIACCIGAFLWEFLNRPFTYFIAFVPAVTFFTIIPYSSYKDKFLSMVSFLGFMALLEFIFAVLYDYPMLMTLSFFILVLIFVAKTNYRYAIVFAVLWAVIYLAFPQKVLYSQFRLIEDLCIFVIVAILIFIYEIVFSQIILYRSMSYLLEIVYDSLIIYTSKENSTEYEYTKAKYLSKSFLIFKPEITVEKFFKTDIERISHRMLMEMIKNCKFINDEEFYFKQNRDCKNKIFPIFIKARRAFRSFSFSIEFRDHHKDITNLFPETFQVIDASLLIIKECSKYFSSNKKILSYSSFIERYTKWEAKFESSITQLAIESQSYETITGLSYLFSDINYMADYIIKNFNEGTHKKMRINESL